MRDIDDLVPFVTKFAPNAALPEIYRQLRDAGRFLCEKAPYWRETDTINIVDPSFEGLCSTQDADIVRVESARICGRKLTPRTVPWLDAEYPGWRTDTDCSNARYVTQLEPNSVTVYPRETGELELGVVLEPSLTALTVPDWMVDKFATQLGRAAAGQLLLMPGDTANPKLGAPLIAEFEGWVATQAVKAAKGQQGARLRTKGVFF